MDSRPWKNADHTNTQYVRYDFIIFVLHLLAGTRREVFFFVRSRVHQDSQTKTEIAKISLVGRAQKSWDHLQARLEWLGILHILWPVWAVAAREKREGRVKTPVPQGGGQNEETAVKKQIWEMPGDKDH